MANTLSFGQSTASYLSGTSPSFQQSLTSDVTAIAVPGITDVEGLALDIDTEFGIDEIGQYDFMAAALSGLGALSGNQSSGWTFITAPEDISWDIANQATRVDIFGTNNPPVVAGSRGMRDLTLSNSLVEGFVRNVTIEGKVAALENLMNYGLNTSDGFVSVPVYQVWANEKSYGGPEAYYIIKDVKVKETMRDLKGNATRAYVDVSFMQVPEYQVNTGRDQASKVTAGGVGLTPQQKAQAAAAVKAGTDGKTAAAAAGDQANQGVGSQAKPAAGPNSASKVKPVGQLPTAPISTR